MKPLKFSASPELHNFATSAPASTVVDALGKLESASSQFIIVTDENARPQALATKADLADRPSGTTLIDLIPHLPSLLTVEADLVCDQPVLKDLGMLLKDHAAKGVLVMTDGSIKGVLPRVTVAANLDVSITGSQRLYGDPVAVPRCYVCRKCTPSTYRCPVQGAVPDCPRNLAHGPMEPLTR
jgi:hypothetical protein